MSKGWEKFFFVFSYLMQGASYLSPTTYAIMHRMHHAYTDTDKDPHSPSYSKNLLDMMFKTSDFYVNVFFERIPIEPRFKKNLPEWRSFDRAASSVASRVMWMVIYIAIYTFYATSPWQFLLVPLHIVINPLHGVVINWFAHKYGYRNYEVSNTSENLFKLDLLMLGEAYHNNHHKRPSAANFGVRWHELDPVYPVIKLLNWLNVIQLTPKPAIKVAGKGIVAHEPEEVSENAW